MTVAAAALFKLRHEPNPAQDGVRLRESQASASSNAVTWNRVHATRVTKTDVRTPMQAIRQHVQPVAMAAGRAHGSSDRGGHGVLRRHTGATNVESTAQHSVASHSFARAKCAAKRLINRGTHPVSSTGDRDRRRANLREFGIATRVLAGAQRSGRGELHRRAGDLEPRQPAVQTARLGHRATPQFHWRPRADPLGGDHVEQFRKRTTKDSQSPSVRWGRRVRARFDSRRVRQRRRRRHVRAMRDGGECSRRGTRVIDTVCRQSAWAGFRGRSDLLF
jgi:hypothetical protein